MITTLEDFKQAAIELCEKYNLDKDCYVSIIYRITNDEKFFAFSHWLINKYQAFNGPIAEDILTTVESEMQKIKDPLYKAQSYVDKCNEELIAAGKQPLSIE